MEINIEEIKLNTKIQGDETLKTAPNSSTSSTINIKKDATIEEVLNLFNRNRKLLSVLITKGGTINETPIGIITTADVIYLNDILDNY